MKIFWTANEDCGKNLSQFEILCEEYSRDAATRLTHFAHSIKPASNEFQLDQKVKKANKNWKYVTEEFDSRYHSKMRRSRAVRNIQNLKLKSDLNDDVFREQKGKIESLSCLAHV